MANNPFQHTYVDPSKTPPPSVDKIVNIQQHRHNSRGTGRLIGVGLGDAVQSTELGVSAGTSLAISVLGLSAASAALASSIVGAALIPLVLWLGRKGPKQKTITTNIVNEAEPFLQQNLAAFQSQPRTEDEKAVSLQMFDAIWGKVVSACSDPSLGDPGRACIQDRQRGGKWDWFVYYRDPIANAPTQSAMSQVASGASETFSNITSTVGGSFGGHGFLLLGLGILGYMFFASGDK